MTETTSTKNAEHEAYKTMLEGLSDDDLVDEVESKVWLSAYASNNPRSKYHVECDATHDECRRRDKAWLYQKGWNAAYRSQGYQPSDGDIASARPPQTEEPQA